MPVINDIVCTVVDDFGPAFVVTADGTQWTATTNITGWSLVFVIHQTQGDGTPLKTYTTGGGQITIPVGTDGKFVVTIPNADIVALGAGNFYYYVYRSTSGKMACLSQGDFSIGEV